MRTGLQKSFSLLVLAVVFRATAAEVLPPKPVHYFNDYANVIPATTAQQLDRTLENYERETSSQVVVAVFPKMQSDSSIEDYSQRIFEHWKVGQKGTNNGAVLLVFIQDRKMRIHTGYGLEGALPDALGKRIIEDEIKPFFKSGDYAGGLTAGVNGILQAIKGEYKGSGRIASDRTSSRPSSFFIFFIIALIFFSMFSRLFRRRGTVYSRRGRGFYGGVPFLLRSGGGSRGGGWSGGGGGGFSGGGGSSGGGGASGSW